MTLVSVRLVAAWGLLMMGACGASGDDADGDGVASPEDCDDSRSDVFPGADEVCDGLDNDCDELVDDEDVDWVQGSERDWYGDGDGDGYGDGSVGVSCSPPEGAVATDDDCDDSLEVVHPGAVEICDGLDNDCDDLIDTEDPDVDLTTIRTWYLDVDLDGYGQPFTEVEQCAPPEGYVGNNDDCNDGEPLAWSNAPEVCDDVDNDCDALVDDDDELDRDLTPVFHPDLDGDGFGNPSTPVWACSMPVAHVDKGDDCRDDNPLVHPYAAEICDGVDNDCDFEVDGDDPQFDPTVLTWTRDLDGDGYGDDAVEYTGCAPPVNYVLEGGDCADLDEDRSPGNSEICDEIDNDCDPTTVDADGWWDPGWPYRVRLEVVAADDVPSAPVTVDVDFTDALETFSDASGLAEGSVRVVYQSCSSAFAEVPSQVEDGLAGLLTGGSSADPPGDGRYAVAFLYDTDGDPATAEAPSGEARFNVYFASNATVGAITAPVYPSGLAASVNGASNDLAEVVIDGDFGGLIAEYSPLGGPVLASQTDASAGNGLYSDQWLSSADTAAGSLAVIASGPVFAVIQSEGTRSSTGGGFTYQYTHLMFDGRPELYTKVSLVTDRDTDIVQNVDYTRGIRPFQVVSPYFESAPGDATIAGDQSWVDQSDAGGGWGLSVGFVDPPLHHEYAYSTGQHMFLSGNEIEAVGSGTIASFPAGVALVDHRVVVSWLHSEPWSDASAEMMGLLGGSVVHTDGADAR